MRIGGPDLPVRTGAVRPRGGGGGFALPDLNDEEAGTAGCAQTAAPAATSAVMPCADWAGGDRPVDDREARRHGEAMLDALAGLQLAQLGGDTRASLAGLASLASAHASASDPGLRSVLQAIAARAAVELARVS